MNKIDNIKGQNLWYKMKSMIKVYNTKSLYEKVEKTQISSLMIHLKDLEKQEQTISQNKNWENIKDMFRN